VATHFAEFESDLDIVADLNRYPIHRLDSRIRAELVAETRSQIDAVGCCRVADFIRPEAVDTMLTDTKLLHTNTFWAEAREYPYASKDDPAFAEDHPRPSFQERMNGPHHSVNYCGRATDLYDERELTLADGPVD
jgi:hypothetical protein